jgi:GT2 family glycosyltransferase
MYRAELFDCVGGYAEDRQTTRCEDYELFMRLFCLGFKGYNIQQPLFWYFISRDNYHSRPLKYHLYESHVRSDCFRQMGLGWYKRWLYVLRPIASALLPTGLITKHKERIAEL